MGSRCSVFLAIIFALTDATVLSNQYMQNDKIAIFGNCSLTFDAANLSRFDTNVAGAAECASDAAAAQPCDCAQAPYFADRITSSLQPPGFYRFEMTDDSVLDFYIELLGDNYTP